MKIETNLIASKHVALLPKIQESEVLSSDQETQKREFVSVSET